MALRIMKTLHSLSLALLAIGLGACAAVYHPAPLGEAPAALDPADWDGLWTEPDVGFVIRTVDAEQGLLDVMVIDGESTRSSEVRIMRSGGWLFGSTRDYDPETQTADPDAIPVRPALPWVFFRVVNQGDTLVLWLPHAGRFQAAVERGLLPGRVEEGEYTNEVLLERLSPDQQRVITESREGVLMDWENPIVLRRVIGKTGGGARRSRPD